MIIQCTSCSRKFLVKEKDIPAEGRTVQCGFCSVTWHQKPIVPRATSDIKNNVPPVSADNEDAVSQTSPVVKASDGKTYKFLGSQWAEVLSSGKTGIFATKKIGQELNKTTGRKIEKKQRMKIDPSSLATNNSKQLPEVYKSQKGLGFLGYVILIIIIFASLIGVIKTFENVWLSYFPQDQYIFELLNMQLDYVAETFKNIFTIAKDLYNSY